MASAAVQLSDETLMCRKKRKRAGLRITRSPLEGVTRNEISLPHQTAHQTARGREPRRRGPGAAPPARGGRGADVRLKVRAARGRMVERRAAQPHMGGAAGGRRRRAAERTFGGGGARAVARPKVRGAAVREPKASARGAARGKRGAPARLPRATRRTATNGSGAPVMPLVALARQFAALSAESEAN